MKGIDLRRIIHKHYFEDAESKDGNEGGRDHGQHAREQSNEENKLTDDFAPKIFLNTTFNTNEGRYFWDDGSEESFSS